MNLDGEQTRRNHIEKTAGKTKRKINVLKRFAGSEWSSSR
jgi:hypothetical protein